MNKPKNFRAKVTKCTSCGESIATTNWNCDGTTEIITKAYTTEDNLIQFGVPSFGRYKLEIFNNPLETYNGYKEIIIVANAKIIHREADNGKS